MNYYDEIRNKLIDNEDPKVEDLIKNPIIIMDSNNYAEISEKLLQKRK